MMRGLISLVLGVAVYISVSKLITTLITGTGTGDTLIQTLVPIGIAIGLVVLSLKSKRLWGTLKLAKRGTFGNPVLTPGMNRASV